jgi:hypothetical protein
VWPTAGKLWRLIWRVWIAVRCRVAAITAGYLHRRLGVERRNATAAMQSLALASLNEVSLGVKCQAQFGQIPWSGQ